MADLDKNEKQIAPPAEDDLESGADLPPTVPPPPISEKTSELAMRL